MEGLGTFLKDPVNLLQKFNFATVMWLEKTLESPLDCKEITPANPKGNQP